jgi:hypothetical protein
MYCEPLLRGSGTLARTHFFDTPQQVPLARPQGYDLVVEPGSPLLLETVDFALNFGSFTVEAPLLQCHYAVAWMGRGGGWTAKLLNQPSLPFC